MKYLITGVGGFIGNVLARDLLALGYQVRGLDNFHRGNCDGLIPLISNPHFEFVKGDVTNPADVENALRGVDGVFHLAAIVGNPATMKNPTLAEAVNVQGTKNIANLKSPEQRLVFCSTECVYGESPDYRENSTPLPTSLYAKHKLAAENEILNCDSKNSVIFRFGAAMGLSITPRINLLVNTLCYEALTNKNLVIFEADVTRNLISVKDMSRSLIFAMENNMSGQIYNAASCKCTKRTVAEYIQFKTDCHVFYGDFNKDPDKRDKPLDCYKLKKEGFYFQYRLDETIDELLKGLKLVNVNHQYF